MSSLDSDFSFDDIDDEVSSPVETIGMRYLWSYAFPFASIGSWAGLAQLSFWMLIPVVGQIVAWGYGYEAAEHLIRNPNQPAPAFSGKKYDRYTTRGGWPFLLFGLSTLIVLPVVFVTLYVLLVAIAILFIATFNQDLESGGLILGLIVGLVAAPTVIFVLGLSILLTPMMLRCGLGQSFDQAFRYGWVWDFFRRTWFELLMTVLFVFVSGTALATLVGVLSVGLLLPTCLVLTHLSITHLQMQLYQLYLHRGGEPIAFAPIAPEREPYS